MTAAQILAALADHGVRIVVDGDRVRLIFRDDNAPPDELIEAARGAKAALREIVLGAEPVSDDTARPPPVSEPTDRWILIAQRWGASLAEASKLVNAVSTAAGFSGTERRARVGELFDRMEARRCWVGRRKVEWLKGVALEMRRDSLAKLRKSVVTNWLPRMEKAGEVIRVRLGVYALPESGADQHVPACRAIITVLLQAQAKEARTVELVAKTGLPRNTVDSAAYRMISKGALVHPEGKRGVFALSDDTLEKIRHGEAVRVGHEVFEMPRSLIELNEWRPPAAAPQ
jgi:hypothetical protein